jgi:hypothetical protein
MKTIFKIILLLAISGTTTFGQRNAAEIEMKGGKAQNVFSTSDTYGNLAYIFQESKSIQISILDANYTIKNEFLINRSETEKKNEVIGATLSAQNVVVYLYDAKERNLASLVVDRFSGNHKFNSSIGSIDKAEYMLKSFEMDGVFYSIVIPQHKNAALLFASTEGGDYKIKNYEINFPTFYAKLSSNNEDLNQRSDTPVGIEKITYDLENNIKSTYPTKKMYTYDNKIYMTFEEPSHTHLIIIDPNSYIATYRKLNFSLDKDKNGNESTPRQGNSFLYKGNLFRATFNNSQLNLIVVNLVSMELLKSYNVFPDQDIPFINGIIKEDGNDIQDRVIKNTQQYFKKIHKGKLAIAVNDLNDGQYEIELGAYEEVVTFRNSGMGGYPMSSGLSFGMGGMGMGMGGMGIGMGMGGMGMGYGGMGMGGMGMGMGGYPGYYPYGGGNGGSSTSIHATYFQSLLRTEDLSHIEGTVPKTIREKVNDYEQDVLRNTSPELFNVIPSYNGLILGYYIKGKSKYILVEFKR